MALGQDVIHTLEEMVSLPPRHFSLPSIPFITFFYEEENV